MPIRAGRLLWLWLLQCLLRVPHKITFCHGILSFSPNAGMFNERAVDCTESWYIDLHGLFLKLRPDWPQLHQLFLLSQVGGRKHFKHLQATPGTHQSIFQGTSRVRLNMLAGILCGSDFLEPPPLLRHSTFHSRGIMHLNALLSWSA